VILDDNTYANYAIKQAIGCSRNNLIGFEACHIWPGTCYDERYHTLVANLVLLPRALACLTDHYDPVGKVLQYRAFELYGWHPENREQPTRPLVGYPDTWREPQPFSSAVAIAVTRRLSDLQAANLPDPDDAIGMAPISRDFTKYDVTVSDRTWSNLPKRIAMITYVKALVESGVTPTDIAAKVPALQNRLFQSADGHLASAQFIDAIARQRGQQGRSFDPSRYFCEDRWLICANGRTFALTNQWGGWTADTIDALVRAFPGCAVAIKKNEVSPPPLEPNEPPANGRPSDP
jgi:hypothetical protein